MNIRISKKGLTKYVILLVLLSFSLSFLFFFSSIARPTAEKFKVTLNIDKSQMTHKTLYITIQNLQDTNDNLNLKTILNSTNSNINQINNVNFYIWDNSTYNEMNRNCTTTNQEVSEWVAKNSTWNNYTKTDNVCYPFQEEKWEYDWIPKNLLSTGEDSLKGELRHQWEQTPIQKSGQPMDTLKFKLEFGHPIVQKQDGWGSKGILWLYVNGVEYVDLTSSSWWNESWGARVPIIITEPIGINRTNEPVANKTLDKFGIWINTSGSRAIVDCTKEIRIIANNSNEVPSAILIDSAPNCFVIFPFNLTRYSTTDNTTTYYAYYNNSNASTPDYSSNFGTMLTGNIQTLAPAAWWIANGWYNISNEYQGSKYGTQIRKYMSSYIFDGSYNVNEAYGGTDQNWIGPERGYGITGPNYSYYPDVDCRITYNNQIYKKFDCGINHSRTYLNYTIEAFAKYPVILMNASINISTSDRAGLMLGFNKSNMVYIDYNNGTTHYQNSTQQSWSSATGHTLEHLNLTFVRNETDSMSVTVLGWFNSSREGDEIAAGFAYIPGSLTGGALNRVGSTQYNSGDATSVNGSFWYKVALYAYKGSDVSKGIDMGNSLLHPVSVSIGQEELASSANEDDGRNEIMQGIKNILGAGAPRYDDQQIYTRNTSNGQENGTFDIVTSNSSQIWAFNYITGSESATGMHNLSTTLYILEMSNLTEAQITSEVEDYINKTKIS